MIVLRPYQAPAVDALVAGTRGILQAPCGSGKTLIAAEALRRRVVGADRAYRPVVLWLANTREQCAQAWAALEAVGLHDLPANPVELHVCCPAGLHNEQVETNQITHVIIDECHHAAADTWARIVRRCSHARVVWGLSATPHREDDLAQTVYELIGPVVHRVRHDETERVPATVHMLDVDGTGLMGLVEAESGFSVRELWDQNTPDWQKRKHWRALLQIGVIDNPQRNERAAAGAVYHAAQGDRVLIIVPTIQHGLTLAGLIGTSSELVHSRLSAKVRARLIGEFAAGELPVLIATSLADEGLDAQPANVLVMLAPTRSRRLAEQRTGRVMRVHVGKSRAVIYDWLDTWHPWLLGQARARIKTYERLGYVVREHPAPQRQEAVA